ncbi:hypothetical protein EON76_04985 [bacterium]|nr:MAG: hypothetical protein EON76_04985 [bacterium]
MRRQNGYETNAETSVKQSRFSRFRDSAREKKYYAPNIFVGTVLATTAFNLLTADAAEHRVPQSPETSTTMDTLQPNGAIETITVIEAGPSMHVSFPEAVANFSVTSPESTQFDAFLQNVSTHAQNDPSAVVTFSINGSASDEDRSSSINGDSNLGVPSASNEQLARDYADMAYRQLGESVNASPDADAFRVGTISSQEAVLDQSDQQAIETIAAERGLSRYALLGAYNDKTIQVDGADALTLTTLIDANRGATITSSIERTVEVPAKPSVDTNLEVIAQTVAQPIADTPHRFTFLPFALPLRMRRRKNAENTATVPVNEPITSYAQMPNPVAREFNPAASAIPATQNYNDQLSATIMTIPEHKPRLVERMPPMLRRMTRPLRHQVSYAMSEFERKKSGREMDRSNRASMKRSYSQLREKPSLRRIARDFKDDVSNVFKSRI